MEGVKLNRSSNKRYERTGVERVFRPFQAEAAFEPAEGLVGWFMRN